MKKVNIKNEISFSRILFLLWMIGLIFYIGIPEDKTNTILYINPEIIILIFILSLVGYFKKNKRIIILLIILLLLLQIFGNLMLDAIAHRDS